MGSMGGKSRIGGGGFGIFKPEIEARKRLQEEGTPWDPRRGWTTDPTKLLSRGGKIDYGPGGPMTETEAASAAEAELRKKKKKPALGGGLLAGTEESSGYSIRKETLG